MGGNVLGLKRIADHLPGGAQEAVELLLPTWSNGRRGFLSGTQLLLLHSRRGLTCCALSLYTNVNTNTKTQKQAGGEKEMLFFHLL